MTQAILSVSQYAMNNARDFYALCKPRVTALIVFTALAALLIATPAAPSLTTLLSTVIGIALVSAAAAALNALVEMRSDANMERTRRRPLPGGRVTGVQAGLFAALIGLTGLGILYLGANPLTMWLALASFFGYGVIYTLLLKPYTSQNIVIGGAAGAMPPVLGWSAATNSVGVEALLLFLIIFVWTPPHFWSLALYYRDDYARGGFPMLPVTRGIAPTQLNILVYTAVLLPVSLLPWFYGLAGWLYLLAALLLGARFLHHASALYRDYSDERTMVTFRFSVLYLFCLFAALIVDHYLLI